MTWVILPEYLERYLKLIPMLDLATARKLLGPKAIIGVTCSSVSEAHAATLGGANYLGIGTMFATLTYVLLQIESTAF